MCCCRLVRVVAAGRDGRAVAAVAELRLRVVEAVNVEAVGIEVRDEVVRVSQEDDGLVARLRAYFEQALQYLKGGEDSHRVAVGCHLAVASFQEARGAPTLTLNRPAGCALLMYAAAATVVCTSGVFSVTRVNGSFPARNPAARRRHKNGLAKARA